MSETVSIRLSANDIQTKKIVASAISLGVAVLNKVVADAIKAPLDNEDLTDLMAVAIAAEINI